MSGEALREKVEAAIDALDTVAVEWAPAHFAPYVSRDLVRAVVSALLSDSAPSPVREPEGLDVTKPVHVREETTAGPLCALCGEGWPCRAIRGSSR